MDEFIRTAGGGVQPRTVSVEEMELLLRDLFANIEPHPSVLLMSLDTKRRFHRILAEMANFTRIHRVGRARIRFARTRNEQKVAIRRCD